MKGIPSFWVDSAERIDVAANAIQHKVRCHPVTLSAVRRWEGPGPAAQARWRSLNFDHKIRLRASLQLAHGELIETKDWLKPGPLVVGVTSGGEQGQERRGGRHTFAQLHAAALLWSAARLPRMLARRVPVRGWQACTAAICCDGPVLRLPSPVADGCWVLPLPGAASTPDKAVEDVLDRVFRIKDPSFT